MHEAVWRALCNASRAHTRHPCRMIAGCRHPIATRKFHRSAIALQKPDPTKPNDTNEPTNLDPKSQANENGKSSSHEGVAETGEPILEKYPRSMRARGQMAAAIRRQMRSQKPVEVPSVTIPEWFLSNNVTLRENATTPKHLGASGVRDAVQTWDFNYGDLFEKEVTNVEEFNDFKLKAEELLSKALERLEEIGSTSKRNAENPPTSTPDQDIFKNITWQHDEEYPTFTSEEVSELASLLITKIDFPEAALIGESKSETKSEEAMDTSTTDVMFDQSALAAKQMSYRDVFETLSTKLRRFQDYHSFLQTRIQVIDKLTKYELRGVDYKIDLDIYEEILVALKAGLSLRSPANLKLKDVHRPITLLQCPKDGGALFLNTIVQHVAFNLDADLIRIDAQDIAQIVDNYLGENVAWTRSPTSVLGYEAQKAAGNLEDHDDLDEHQAEDTEEVEDGAQPKSFAAFLSPHVVKLQRNGGSGKSLLSLIQESGAFGKNTDHDHDHGSASYSEPSQHSGSKSDDYVNHRLPAVLEKLVDAASICRAEAGVPLDQTSTEHNLIIQINEYMELDSAPGGAEILSQFRDIVRKRWFKGQNVLIVGTTSAEDLCPELTSSGIKEIQSGGLDTSYRTIFVPPSQKTQSRIDKDAETYMKDINVRHIEDMIRKLVGSRTLVVDIRKALPEITEEVMKESVWGWSHVHRVATTILGFPDLGDMIDGPTFSRAVELLQASDKAKIAWGVSELKTRQKQEQSQKHFSEDEDAQKESNSTTSTQRKLSELKETCSRYEKRLLGGVIDPKDINTTFSHVRAPPETIEALKTLTSLSLIRPEAFSYGVLATDKISGLLLYGPPGTGKTMLAKAVAKESGATVLEVSGGDLYDKYVGEGEKLVKALFSLAKKLSPCVVFIDEADAIFGARGGSVARASHRELINQFLREWDGLNDLSAFIMVATNRPFDLDDAVLRRLPRRVLVDLPLEKDREEILKIHLRDETLDDSVSISALAQNTPFYSGSDLKNLCVAAALACVREENANAAKHTGSEPYVYPPRRILTKKHFEKAIEEISASVSEDMGTLTAIRKFDAKYGDKKGRKKPPGLGFGLQEPEKDSDAARVRQGDF